VKFIKIAQKTLYLQGGGEHCKKNIVFMVVFSNLTEKKVAKEIKMPYNTNLTFDWRYSMALKIIRNDNLFQIESQHFCTSSEI
jgi:hypothetical protein